MAASVTKYVVQPLLRPREICSKLRVFGVVSERAFVLPSGRTDEKITHTGQVFEEDDYRKVRFIGRQKEVNERFAINLVAEEPPIEVEENVTFCNGGGGPLGHPRVYINLDNDAKFGTCGYCGLRFKRKPHH